MKSIVEIWILCFLFAFENCKAATHWVVTEEGKIQAQPDSIYNMKRPYDLIAFLEQEKRAVLVEDLKKQLIIQKEEIDKNEDKETDLEAKLYATDTDCILAGKQLADFDLYTSTLVPFPEHLSGHSSVDLSIHMGKVNPNTEFQKPNCTAKHKLDFSMSAFEHLKGVRGRANLEMPTEDNLYRTVTGNTMLNIDIYGHLVNDLLSKNTTSWISYNMAAYYWRVAGDPENAVECIRRALHFSPRKNKDIALINLANILHHSHLTDEAALVSHAAVDIEPENPIAHFSLGNIYAVLMNYSKSAEHFKNALTYQPNFRNAIKRYHAVSCHTKIEGALEAQHASLQKTLGELNDYQKAHNFYVQQQEKLISEQAPPEVKLEQQLEYERRKVIEGGNKKAKSPTYCIEFEKNGQKVLTCDMQNVQQADISWSLQMIHEMQSRAEQIKKRQKQYSPEN